MQQKLLGRFLVVVGVVVLALYFIFPSARMIQFRLTTSPPDPADTEAVEAYSSKTKTLEGFVLPMGARPIPYGLDLQGGTDITIELDKLATHRNRLVELKRDINRQFGREQIDATLTENENDKTLSISLSRVEDARMAGMILNDKRLKASFEGWDVNRFENSGKVVLNLDSSHINRIETEAMEGALKVIRNRVNGLGLTQAVVVRQGLDRIRVQMPGVSDPQRVVDNIIRPAQLEFRLLHDKNDEILDKLFTEEAYKQVCAYIAKFKTLPDPLPVKEGAEVPLGYVMRPGEAPSGTTGDVNERPEAKYKPYVVRDNVELTGDVLRSTWARFNQMKVPPGYEIHFEMNRQGAVDFKDLTSNNLQKQLAILLDDFLYSAPLIKVVIPNGQGYIEGDFTYEEATDLSLVLKAGAIPANLKVVDKYVVEASLGADSIRKGVQSLMLGAVVVVIFMLLYYGASGGIAVVALIVNVLCVIAILALSQATLTLSGIGGILLTIGMAVDANVLIYERIREERETSRGLKQAITKGFSRAFTVIFDSNLTTLLTALVLLQFGTGSVQGFALTMTFGIFATLFTGLFVTHVLTDLWFSWRGGLGIGKLRVFRNPKINFIGLRRVGYFISGALLVFGFGTMIAKGGPQFGVEFTGGAMTQVTFNEETSEDEIKVVLGQYFPTPIVQRVQGEDRFLVRVRSESEGTTATTSATMEKALKDHYQDRFRALGEVREVSDEVGGEFIQKAIVAIVIASIGVLLFLWFRFELVFGAGAVVALFHDVLITLGLLSVFNQELTLNVVAALLIVVGYSVNDTIVIFDRIRETIRTTYGMAYADMLNQSINRSLNRTTITSLSTLFVTLIMLTLGGPGLRGFALVLSIGVVIGTYSSSFVAAPVLYEYHEYRRRKYGESATPMQKKGKVR